MIHKAEDHDYWTVRLADNSRLLSISLPKSLAFANDFFERTALPFDKCAFGMLTRLHLRASLAGQFVVIDDDEVAITPDSLANIGLKYNYNDICVKIRKAQEGAVPIPETATQVDYMNYNRQISLFEHAVVLYPITRLRVFYIWDHGFDRRLSLLRLVCTKSASLKSPLTELYWDEPIPFDDESGQLGPTAPPPTPKAPREESPITLPQPETAELIVDLEEGSHKK